MNPSPGNLSFEVWFVPATGASLRLSEPLRVGQPLADQDEAQDLAQAAAKDLPAYGFPRGQVRIQMNASVVQVLPTAQMAARHPARSSSRQDGAQTCAASSQREVALLALEDLRRQVGRARPSQVAPAAWIACLEQALRVLASPDDQQRHRLDGQPCVTVDALHQRVVAVLRQFGQPVAADTPLPQARESEPALAP